MKILSALTASVLLLSGAAMGQEHGDHDMKHEHETHDHDADHAAMKGDARVVDAVDGRTVTVKVNGMVCDFCAQSLTKVLKRKDAVDDVAISLEDKTVTIVLKDGGEMSDDEIEKAVLDAGYNLASIERA